MKNKRNNHIRYIKKAIKALLVLCWFFFPFSVTHAEEVMPADSTSYIFSYRNKSGILELSLNKESLIRIDKLVRTHRSKILLGKGHFSIISYIRPCDLNRSQQLNAASVQGSVARAYLKSMHNIDHSNVTFAFDTAHYTNYKVRVSYVSASITAADNQEIYYTLDKNIGAINRAALCYQPIPLIQRAASYKVLPPTVATTQESTPHEQTSTPIPQDTYPYRPDPRLVVVEVLKPTYRKHIYPCLAIKTNLLTWAGVMPKVDYRYITPNMELECFMGKRWSVNVDGYYVNQDMKSVNKELWAASSVGLEPRLWFRSNGRFGGFYTGVYGTMGQFDIKIDKLSPDGYTGDVKEGGLSLGCYLPLFSSRWGIEFGARYGYRMVSYDSYEHNSAEGRNYFYYQSSHTKNGLQCTDVRLLVSYRLGKSIVYKKR